MRTPIRQAMTLLVVLTRRCRKARKLRKFARNGAKEFAFFVSPRETLDRPRHTVFRPSIAALTPSRNRPSICLSPYKSS